MKIIASMFEYDNHIYKKHYCGKYAWFNPANGEAFVFFCGQSSCARKYCQKIFYFKRVRLISDLINEKTLDRFFTLTMKRSMSRKESWIQIPHIWNKTRTTLKQRYPEMQFCAVLEANKDGYPHIHGFVNIYIHQREWSKTFAGCGGGSYAWIEKIDVKNGTVENYVAKELNIARYVGKAQIITARQMVKKRARTFWRSTGMKTECEMKKKDSVGSSVVMVKENLYRETEEGFDKLHKVVYNDSIGQYTLIKEVQDDGFGEKVKDYHFQESLKEQDFYFRTPE